MESTRTNLHPTCIFCAEQFISEAVVTIDTIANTEEEQTECREKHWHHVEFICCV